MPEPSPLVQWVLDTPVPTRDMLDSFQGLMATSLASTKVDPTIYKTAYEWVVGYNDWVRAVDTLLSLQLPQDGAYVQMVADQLTGMRQFIANMYGEFRGMYENSKKQGWVSKVNDGQTLTDRTRERTQDSVSAPFGYLVDSFKARIDSIDKKLVTCNRLLEMENTLVRRGGV